MREILKRNLGITNEAFQQQRRVYEQLTNSSILELTREDLVRQVRQYELQQPLFKVRICLPPPVPLAAAAAAAIVHHVHSLAPRR